MDSGFVLIIERNGEKCALGPYDSREEAMKVAAMAAIRFGNIKVEVLWMVKK